MKRNELRRDERMLYDKSTLLDGAETRSTPADAGGETESKSDGRTLVGVRAHAPCFTAWPVCVRHVAPYTYISHGAPIQGGQENSPLRENRPCILLFATRRVGPAGSRAQPPSHVHWRSLSIPKFDCRPRRGRKDTGKRRRQLVANSFFSARRNGKRLVFTRVT